MIVEKQRVVISMIDGFGTDYFEASPMPVLKSMSRRGLFKTAGAVFPTVTNANNVSICCGAWPETHGITGNSYFDETSGQADYMESADFILVPTVLERAAQQGISCALLTCKDKTIRLLGQGTNLAVAAESPPADFIDRFGKPPPIYSREINYWLWTVAIDLLKYRNDIQLLYVHTTDFPMHAWAPAQPESQEHLAKIDQLIGAAQQAAPDAAFLITADHGMNYKKRCWDLMRACKQRGLALRFALSAEKDRYVKHHRTFGGAAWVWLHSPDDQNGAIKIIAELERVETVMPKKEAAARFHLMPERIGDLIVIGDRHTVFGDLETEVEQLESTYRSYGSLYESEVPLIIFNCVQDLPADEFKMNFDITRIPFRLP